MLLLPTLRPFQILFLFLYSFIFQVQCFSINGKVAYDHFVVNDTINSEINSKLIAKKHGICFERIAKGDNQITFTGFPSNKRRALVGTQAGVIKLVSLPVPGSGKIIKPVSTWLDISSRIHFSGEQGLLGLAFHPNFLKNGKFYVSYICDSQKFHDCKGPCPCSKATGCNPKSEPKSGCRYNTVVAEYSVGSKPAKATKVKGKEVRRILTFARPFENHNGGWIFFGIDGYLYYTSGDGGYGGDPWNFAQKGNTFLGKILRINVNGRTKSKNYTVPKNNPFVKYTGVRKEIFALGLRNPWRCSVDKNSGAIFCGDVGQNKVEEVDRILPGRNYGWRSFEGTQKYDSSDSPVPSTPVSKMRGILTRPILQYTHNSLPLKWGAIIGGVVYRAKRNKCFQGKYLYNDYSGPMWLANVYSKNPVATNLYVKCSSKSPIKCPQSDTRENLGSSFFSWGVDSANEVYLLSDAGIFRVINLANCGFSC